MTCCSIFWSIVFSCCIVGCAGLQEDERRYDLVIANGRVIDPETGFDAKAYVGIIDGSIKRISLQSLSATEVVDASGLVVAPGFIDVHSHSPTLLGQRVNLLDGITTQLDLEAGGYPVDFYGEHFSAGAQINYGASVGHWAVRTKVMEGIDQPYVFAGDKFMSMLGSAWTERATLAQIEQMRELLNIGLD